MFRTAQEKILSRNARLKLRQEGSDIYREIPFILNMFLDHIGWVSPLPVNVDEVLSSELLFAMRLCQF